MEDLKWRSEYNVGEYLIDNEHQKLFSIARKALKVASSKETKDDMNSLKTIVKELFSYVGTHFCNEEKFMEKIKYPNIDEHKLIHKQLTKSLTKLIEEFNSLELEEIKSRLKDFISDYFIKHIITEDKKIQLFITPLEDLRKSFGWKDVYSVNEKFIDEEHKELFDIASLAFKEVKKEEKSQKIKEVLKDLYEYMKKHFNHEEKFMEKIKYPNIDGHKEIHKSIIKRLNEFTLNSINMDLDILEKELAKIIDISLVQHIIQEDRKITSWANSLKN